MLKAAGKGIEKFDPIIVATALEQGLLLITGNTRHYQRIVELGFPLKLRTGAPHDNSQFWVSDSDDPQ
jgi:predicted nucleic acid-binding protein